jgi:thiol:disulfide interchange protein DsbD
MPPLLAAVSSLTDALQHRPLVAVFTLFGAGVVTSLTPCIYPMIPITAGLLAGTAQGNASRRKAVGLTLTFVTGLALFYAILGLLAGMTGTLFGTVSSSPWARFAIGNLLLVFGLAMLDVFPVAAPRRLLAWAGNLGGGSYPAVFLLGATSGIVAAPCGAPAFGVVLTWVAATQSAVLGFVYLFVFSLGMTALLAVVGVFSGTAAILPKAGPWMVWVKKAAGIVMLAMAEYYFVQMGMVL